MISLDIVFDDADTGVQQSLWWDGESNSLVLRTQGEPNVYYAEGQALDLSYDKEHWNLAIEADMFLVGFLAAKWGLDAANTLV